MTARDDCGFGLAGSSIDVPILANDGVPSTLPAKLQLELPSGDIADQLWLSDDGVLHYDSGDGASGDGTPVIWLRYRDMAADDDPEAIGEVVFLLRQGDQPPEVDARVAAACSQTAPHRTIPSDQAIEAAPEAQPVGSCEGGVALPATVSGYRIKVLLDQLQDDVIRLENDSYASSQSQYFLIEPATVGVEGGVLIFQSTGGVVFLAGTDRDDLEVSYVHPGNFGPECRDHSGFLDFFNVHSPAEAPAVRRPPEITRLVLGSPPAGTSEADAADEYSAVFCPQERCLVLRPSGSSDAVISDKSQPLGADQAGSWFELDQAAALAESRPFLHLAALTPAATAGVSADNLAGALVGEDPAARAVIVRGFFDDEDARLSIGGSHFASAGEMMRFAVAMDVEGLSAQLIPSAVFRPRAPGEGPGHGGGAGFSPIEFGDLGPGLVPLLEQAPTTSPQRPGPQVIIERPTVLNHAPIARDDVDVLAQVGGPGIPIDVLANDSDRDGDPLAIDDDDLGAGALGSVTIDGRTVMYQPPTLDELPDPDQPGRIEDTFEYSIEDGRGGLDTAEVRVDLNRAPEAEADREPLTDGSVLIDVLANDRDLDGDQLRIVDVDRTGLRGQIQIVGGRIEYTRPDDVDAGEPFDDSFTYTIGDGRDGSDSATVVVFDGPVPPTLIVEPSETVVSVLPGFEFSTHVPFPEAEGVAQSDLALDRSRSVRIELVGAEAEFDNSLGWYRIEDGAPVDPQILFANVNDVDGTAPDALARLGTLPADTEFGFFLIQDGFAQNGDVLDPAAEFVFRGEPGSFQLFRVDGDGERAIEGDILHTVDDFNPDGLPQTVSGLDDVGAFTIGFEDKVRADPAQGSDDDFDDAVFTLSYGNVAPPGLELTVDILDPDSELMSSASVTITVGQPGDRLVFDDIFDRQGRLELNDPASTEDFERMLEAVELEVDRIGLTRALEFRVVDTDGQASNIETVMVATDPAMPSGPGLDVLLDVGASPVEAA